MSDNKRYYWLKLNEDFFEDDTIQWIEDQEGGDRYLLFYLKLCLKSIKNDGNLIRYVGEKLIPYDVKALAKLTNTDKDTVAVALKAFEEIGLIQAKSTGEIYMKQIDEMIGTETDAAKRVRRHRAKQKALEETNQMLQCNAALLQSNTVETKSNTEIEKEIEKELELEVEIEVEQEEQDKDINNIPARAREEKQPTAQRETITTVLETISDIALRESLSEFEKHRKALKKPMTPFAMQKLIAKLDRQFDNDAEKINALNVGIERGWLSVEREWIENARTKDTRTGKPSLEDYYAKVDQWAEKMEGGAF